MRSSTHQSPDTSLRTRPSTHRSPACDWLIAQPIYDYHNSYSRLNNRLYIVTHRNSVGGCKYQTCWILAFGHIYQAVPYYSATVKMPVSTLQPGCTIDCTTAFKSLPMDKRTKVSKSRHKQFNITYGERHCCKLMVHPIGLAPGNRIDKV
jgi:hypothetical protein